MEDLSSTIIDVLHKYEKVCPQATNIIQKLKSSKHLNDEEVRDVFVMMATYINTLTAEANRILTSHEKLLQEYTKLVDTCIMLETAPASYYQQ